MSRVQQLQETVDRLNTRLQCAVRALYVLRSNGNGPAAHIALSRVETLNLRIAELNELLDEYDNAPVEAAEVIIDDPDQDDVEMESRGTMWAVFGSIIIVGLLMLLGDWMLATKTIDVQTSAQTVVLEEIVITSPRLVEPTVVKTAEVTTITYIVQPGDTLWSIAAEQLGDGSSWATVYGQNADTIDNPDLIFPGQSLTLSKVSVGSDTITGE